MSLLTPTGRTVIADLAQRYGLSDQAVETMARAVASGSGTMAQFNVPELGGQGQWMAGGMTMVGDMFNHGLQNTVANLCGELSSAMASAPIFEAPQTLTSSWPDWLGLPAATGGQNQARYAYFPESRRLAFDHGDGRPLVVLDTGDHQIGGFSQQQSGMGDPYLGITVSSQFGKFALSSFPLAQTASQPQIEAETAPAPLPSQPLPMAAPEQPPAANPMATPEQAAPDEILGTIEKLARLRDAGALSEEEFTLKKTELLARL